jgi:hypothetical protein
MAGIGRRRKNSRSGTLATRSDATSPDGHLTERLARLPDNVRPFFEEFRDYVHEEAVGYVNGGQRPRTPSDFKDFIARFLERIEIPIDAAQRAVITLGYRWPAPLKESGMKVTTTAISAGTAGYGQTIAYGSVMTATVGALTVGVVGEIVELYAFASARTAAYRWAGLYPGEKVVADDLAQILGSKKALVVGTERHVGDELVTALLDRFAPSVVDSVAVPVLGPARAGYRSFKSLRRVYDTPLTKPAEGESYRQPTEAPSMIPTFGELLARLKRNSTLPSELGWSPS